MKCVNVKQRKFVKSWWGLWAVLWCIVSSNANATLLVDTGTPTITSAQSALNSAQSLAGLITFDNAVRLSSIEGYLSQLTAVEKTLTVTIHGTDSNMYGDGLPFAPITPFGYELYSSSFVMDSTLGWFGSSLLDWALDAGDYWVTFEVRAGQTFFGGMPIGAPSPLEDYAHYNATPGYYRTIFDPDFRNLGFRVDAISVPEPATLILLSVGLVLVWGAKVKGDRSIF